MTASKETTQAPVTTPSNTPTSADDLRLREIVAFGLFQLRREVDSETTFDSNPTAATLAAWRENPGTRSLWRQFAELFLDGLQEAGVKVEIHGVLGARKLDKALETIVTVPAAVAYNVISETALKGSPDTAQ